MTRMSKQGERRAISPRRPSPPSLKTGAKKDNLKQGYKPHDNAAPSDAVAGRFIPKVRSV